MQVCELRLASWCHSGEDLLRIHCFHSIRIQTRAATEDGLTTVGMCMLEKTGRAGSTATRPQLHMITNMDGLGAETTFGVIIKGLGIARAQ